MTDTNIETVQWDLGKLYSGIDDPQIDSDIALFSERAKHFFETYRGTLATTLPFALSAYAELQMLQNKIGAFLFLLQSTDVTNAIVKEKVALTDQLFASIEGAYLTFFDIEIISLSDEVLEAMYKENEYLRKHKPYIEYTRIFKNHILTEDVESALTKRSPFSAGAWGEFFDEMEADLTFLFQNKTKTLTEMLHILGEEKNAEVRSSILKIVNDGLAGTFAKYSAQNLYMVAGATAVETEERKYQNPMEHRNKANKVSPEVVNALHDVVRTTGGELARRYYRLKAKALGIQKLRWSDRNAVLPFADTTLIPFSDALKTVLEAYNSFSPTLSHLIQEMVEKKHIDARVEKGRRSGAYNYSSVLPKNEPISFTFLNYLGSKRDIMVLAHELGHGVHGLLAGKEQGSLMFHAPIAYCETASIFGEMTTFQFLKKQLEEQGEKEALLSLLFGKIDDTMNTVVRQIGFSNFERRVHGMDATYSQWEKPKKYSAEQLDSIFLMTLREIYGEHGDVFTYENAEHLWSYVSHFHRPFYVYGYAFGELLTASIYAQKDTLGNSFEPLYLDMLKSGMTRDVIELVKPFGLDPTQKEFWSNGFKELEEMISLAEKLMTN